MPKKASKLVIVAYVPVLHRGYIEFFKKYSPAQIMYVIGEELQAEADVELGYLRKDLRALKATEAVKAIRGLELCNDVRIASKDSIADLDTTDVTLVFPDEDVSHYIAALFSRAQILYHPVFLRWDRRAVDGVDEEVHDSIETTKNPNDISYMKRAVVHSGHSSDIWRRVGALIVLKNRKVFQEAYNQAEPTPSSPLMEGDPRNIFKRGTAIEMSVFSHAEAVLIANAAKQGVPLEAAHLYVTTFPCPACAKLIAHSGISHCYFSEGYAVLDGQRVLEQYNVKVIKVLMPGKEVSNSDELVPYRKS